jgi:predicted phosphoadenosine phosphosulfate sulfurtransferase
MKILSDKNVWDATLERLNYLFDEFPVVVSGVSGGKDSTVEFYLTLKVATERGRLPLPVLWIDQEAEWTSTVQTVRDIMYRPDVRPMWYQMPMHLDNATSYTTPFLSCWDPAHPNKWIHDKDPISIKENRFGTDRFGELFERIIRTEFPGRKVALISGVRAEENPNRFVGLTTFATYKWITWGAQMAPGQYTFYPLYDWSYTDIWHAIHSNKWPYNKIYDYQYRYGVPVPKMRVSNLHHETAVRSLFYLQEIDPALYQRIADRLPGVDAAGKFGEEFYARKLPFMFRDWCEYRDFLIEKLTSDRPEWHAELIKTAKHWDRVLDESPGEKQKSAGVLVQAVLCNDYTGTKINNHQLQFITRYVYDQVDAYEWPGNRWERGVKPAAWEWLQRKVKHDPRYYRGRWTYQLIGDHAILRVLRDEKRLSAVRA